MRTSRPLGFHVALTVLSLITTLTPVCDTCQRAANAVISQAPTYLAVKEWWGFYEITIAGSEYRSGQRSGLPWSSAYRVHRVCEGRFHWDKPVPGTAAPWSAELVAQRAREMTDAVRL